MPIIFKKSFFFLADDVKEAITNREVSHFRIGFYCLFRCVCMCAFRLVGIRDDVWTDGG